MQSMPPPPTALTKTGKQTPPKRLPMRALAWLHRCRRTAATHLLRGLCYGIGTGLAGLAFWWLEQHM